MKKKLRDEWVRALRSGKYNQIRAELTSHNDEGKRGYCCLGVLCRVAGLPLARIEGLCDLDEKPAVRKVRDLAGLGRDFRGELQQKLAKLNDDDELTFPEIADWIEANVPVEP